MTKHVHAELMLQYAQDALTTDTPWELWQYRYKESNVWQDPPRALAFYSDLKYRRKPKTININGFEVPEPVREPLKLDSIYYIPAFYIDDKYSLLPWEGSKSDLYALNNGLIHLTKDAAILHAKALLSFTKKP